jgi:hypothetical protein
MLQLELEKTNAVLLQFKPDVDKVGPLATLKIATVQDADVLAFFEPTLKDFYFNKDGPRDLADGLPLRDPHAVFPHKRDEEMTGAVVKVGYGLGPMVFVDAVLDGFLLTPRDGGRVQIECQVTVRPGEEQAGKLFMLQHQTFELTVEPMELATMADAA